VIVLEPPSFLLASNISLPPEVQRAALIFPFSPSLEFFCFPPKLLRRTFRFFEHDSPLAQVDLPACFRSFGAFPPLMVATAASK